MTINFLSSKKDSDETRTNVQKVYMRTKSDNIEILMVSEKDEAIEELFKSLLQRYQEKSEESMRGSHFIFDSADVLYYDLNRISLSRVVSWKYSSKWLKNKKATINPKNYDDGKCFQYALTVALNYEQIKKDLQKISKVKPFIDQYNWKEINFPKKKA